MKLSFVIFDLLVASRTFAGVVAWVLFVFTAIKRTEELSYLKIDCFGNVLLFVSFPVYILNCLKMAVVLSEVNLTEIDWITDSSANYVSWSEREEIR
jgi:exosortase/archaeosortase